MSPDSYSEHAKKRCAQRGIPHSVVELILEHGRRDYDSRGGCRYFLGKREKQKIIRHCPNALRDFGRKLDAVLVMATDKEQLLITSFIRDKKH